MGLTLSVRDALWCAFFLLFLPSGRASAQPAAAHPWRLVLLPSALPIGDAAVDTIRVRYFAVSTPGMVGPAVVLLPPIGSDDRDPQMNRLAAYLAHQSGISCALMTLPYHGWRSPGANPARQRRPRAEPGRYFLGGEPSRGAAAFAQSASDVRTVTDWLVRQPDVDTHRLGIVGISLGAVVAHLAMGMDPRLVAGVALEGGGDLPDLYRHSLLASVERILWPTPGSMPAPATLAELLRPVDPLTYADRNRPRHVLMVAAARDLYIPPRNARALWQALGHPPLVWTDSNHFALGLVPGAVERLTAAYLYSVWNGDDRTAGYLPPLHVPTLKGGLWVQQTGSGTIRISPAVQWQFAALGTRPDHTSLFHTDLGLSGRGTFLGAGVTLSPFVDIGWASRFGWRGVEPARPYLSLHVTY